MNAATIRVELRRRSTEAGFERGRVQSGLVIVGGEEEPVRGELRLLLLRLRPHLRLLLVRHTSSNEILEVFRRVKPRYKTPTADAVRRVLEPYMQALEEWQRSGREKGKPRPKPLNLVILTDGAPDPDQNPEMVLVETARRLDAGRFPLFQVGCSFVQIGNYTEAAEHLRMLDDDLKEKHGIRDMVDTTLFEGSCSPEYLLKALLGGINRSIDRQG